jgi:translation initiation factor 2 beta subunit (eIF-2beta)/eIF-5
MKLNKLKEKFVVCGGCHKMSTINYTDKEYTKITTCMVCGKISTYKLKKNEIVNRKMGRPTQNK